MVSSPLWVFGYGSLMWDPGFDVDDRCVATLSGYARTFCMHSIHHRGTEAEPGLVLALDKAESASCTGLALCAAAGQEHATLELLRERELISSAYLERILDLSLVDGRTVQAVAYVVDPDHVQYCGGLELEHQAQIIARAHGGRGPNAEYLHNTVAHLAELKLQDDALDWLDRRVREIHTAP